MLSLAHFIAGWIGGGCSIIVGHPMDTIKVRQQNLRESASRTLILTLKADGVRGLFKGMLLPLLTVGPSNAVFFGVYGNVMKILRNNNDQPIQISPHDTKAIRDVFIGGCVAGLFQAFVTCPADLVKTLLQMETESKKFKKHYKVKHNGPFSTFLKVLKKRGLPGIYRGFVPMFYRDVPTSGFYTVTYEMLLYSTFEDWKVNEIYKQIIAGGTAGIVSWISVIPFDVVKTKIQSDDPDNPKYKGMVDCAKIIYQKHGYKEFFKGLPVAVFRSFPSNAAIFVGYEQTLKLLS